MRKTGVESAQHELPHGRGNSVGVWNSASIRYCAACDTKLRVQSRKQARRSDQLRSKRAAGVAGQRGQSLSKLATPVARQVGYARVLARAQTPWWPRILTPCASSGALALRGARRRNGRRLTQVFASQSVFGLHCAGDLCTHPRAHHVRRATAAAFAARKSRGGRLATMSRALCQSRTFRDCARRGRPEVFSRRSS
jgi:hypothetical protein